MARSAQASDAWFDPEDITPDISHIVIEDDAPVDNIYAEKQQRLLTEPLYSSWGGPPPDEDGAPRPFVATANVGLFGGLHEPPLVPDVLVSAGVRVHPEFAREKRHLTYFVWEMGKPPDVVIEVVSNREGGELGKRKRGYQRWRVAHYVVWDPAKHLRGEALVAFELRGDLYIPMQRLSFPVLGLDLAPWKGPYEGVDEEWLRWHAAGQPIPTGAERAARADEGKARAEEEKARAEEEKARAEEEKARAEEEKAHAEEERAHAEEERARAEQDKARAEALARDEKARADRLAALLAAHGIAPEDDSGA